MAFKKLLAAALTVACCAVMVTGQDATADDRIFAVKTTGDLFNLCTLPGDHPLRGEGINYCLGYMDGAVDYHDVLSEHEDMKRIVCYPETATLELGVAVFIAWAEEKEEDTEMMGTPPVVGITRALAKKWPCT